MLGRDVEKVVPTSAVNDADTRLSFSEKKMSPSRADTLTK